jgi:hypothetical protein|tara:strand:+ start:410 stop:529 length:120 start_codon:yes stop_codon:yes gene_type:complete
VEPPFKGRSGLGASAAHTCRSMMQKAHGSFAFVNAQLVV